MCRIEPRNFRETHSQFFFPTDIISCNFNNVQKLLLHIGYEEILPKSQQVSRIRTVSSQSATGRLCAAVSIYHLLVSHLPEKFSAKRAKSNQVQVIIQKTYVIFRQKVIWPFGFIHMSQFVNAPAIQLYISLYRTHSLVACVYFFYFSVFAIATFVSGSPESWETETCLVRFFSIDITSRSIERVPFAYASNLTESISIWERANIRLETVRMRHEIR